MNDLILKFFDKLPVKWTIAFVSVGIIGYFSLQFYKANNDYRLQMAQIEHATPQSSGSEKSNNSNIVVKRIEPKQTKQIAEGVE